MRELTVLRRSRYGAPVAVEELLAMRVCVYSLLRLVVTTLAGDESGSLGSWRFTQQGE
jgi:hypothetical protein